MTMNPIPSTFSTSSGSAGNKPRRRIYYDTEFVEQGAGKPIVPISIGMVTGYGVACEEFYRIVANPELPMMLYHDEWHHVNTLPYLPVRIEWVSGRRMCVWNNIHPDIQYVKPVSTIAKEAYEFCTGRAAGSDEEAPYDPELWAWFADYDHVVLSQLFDRMSQLPKPMPKFTMDVRQLARHIGLDDIGMKVPKLKGVREHHPVDDAKEAAYRHSWLMTTGAQIVSEHRLEHTDLHVDPDDWSMLRPL